MGLVHFHLQGFAISQLKSTFLEIKGPNAHLLTFHTILNSQYHYKKNARVVFYTVVVVWMY